MPEHVHHEPRPPGESSDAISLADHLVRAALAAADPAEALAARAPASLRGVRCRMIAAGKAAAATAAALVQELGGTIIDGVIVAPPGAFASLPSALLGPAVQRFEADHPLPTARNLTAAAAVRDLALRAAADARAGARVPLAALVSGGASAHLSLPRPGVTLDDLRTLTLALLRAGAPIEELNVVRKHLEQLKGGGLARLVGACEVEVLLLSDVIGDDPGVIGSGPFAPDPSTFADALAILRGRAVLNAAPAATDLLQRGFRGLEPETLKPAPTRLDLAAPLANRFDPSPTASIRTTILGSNTLALDAAAAQARELGFHVHHVQSGVTGEARDVGRRLARDAQALADASPHPSCILLGGETTVTLTGDGRGGRNQELVLAAALQLPTDSDVVILSFATDGVDGPTDAAGASVTASIIAEARRAGLDPDAALARNDSHPLFASLGCLIRTGPTGTNVNDVAAAFTHPHRAKPRANAAPTSPIPPA